MIEGPVLLQSSNNMMTHHHFRLVTPPREAGRQTPPSLKINDLSMKEREMALQDLHGVSDIPNEDEVSIQNALRELRGELDLQDSVAADDEELVKFLRADSFDILKAAARFNRFSAFQRKLFGKQDRTKYSDLTDEDVKFLQSGFMQLLPQRDRAGRAIIMCLGSLKQQLKTSLESDLRCLSFLASKAAEDEDTQKRGVVVIYYALAQKAYDGRNNRPVQWLKAFEALPTRVVATHFCYDNSAMKPLLNLLSNHMDTKMLCRFRSHSGQHAECQYSLMSFGIPKECLPIDAFGQVDLTNHQMLLTTIELEEQQKENQLLNASMAPTQLMAQVATIAGEKFLIPGQMDIILGRGQHAKNTPGHSCFTQLLEAHQGRYESAEKSQKTRVADTILKELNLYGCRFLKPRVEGGWLEVSDDAGREKINHAFRNLRSNAKKATSTSRASSQSSSSSRSKKRALNDIVDSWSVPSDTLAPIPLLPSSYSPATKKRRVNDDSDSGFALDLLLSTEAFAL
ncbi:unnamed protein product [Cylindrotheca closterium]|uniref:DUF6824 domain-containing protein n=1 Tax=Cylindrotheca closterium TaxID=2856 RepID=A0AAD2JGF9_9STRA|nr:unnamed protein product [Cylindrotheca closterium]